MDFTEVNRQLEGAAEVLSNYWKIQDNEQDRRTRFYRRYDTFSELIHSNEYAQLSEEDQNTTLHRWYNTKTSETCERIFVEYGAEAADYEQNYFNKIDIFIHDVRFDVKITNFPQNNAVRQMRLDLKKRSDRDRLICWLYQNQSREQRYDTGNRLFIVCKGGSVRESTRLKQSFDQIEVKVRAYMAYLQQSGYDFNTVSVPGADGGEVTVKSEILVILPESDDLKQRLTDPCPACHSRRHLVVAKQGAYRGNMILKCNCDGFTNV